MTDYHNMEAAAPPKKSLQRKIISSVTFWIIIGTLVGVFLGAFAPKFSVKAAPMSQLFLRPIQFIVFPLVFSSLVVGIAGNSNLKQLGRLSIKAFIYFEIVTTFALVIGLISVNIVKPGNGLTEGKPYVKPENASPFTFAAWMVHLTPKTWGEMMGGSGSSELLQVLVASILTGVATALVADEHKAPLLQFARAVMEMMFKFVDIVMWTAPIGVCFAVANSVGDHGLKTLSSLATLVVTVYVTLMIFVIVIFGPIFLIFKINPVEFVKAMREPLIIAYTTATSEAALPKVFEALDAYGVSTHVSAFVVPFGYSFNLDGSTLYLSLASVFCAQATGVDKSIGEQIVMVLMLMISSKGVAGVRSASIIVISATLEQFDIPSWPVSIILSADWFMDMARTFTNVFGNCLAATVMAKLENEFRTEEWENARLLREGAALDDGHLAKMSIVSAREEKLSVQH